MNRVENNNSYHLFGRRREEDLRRLYVASLGAAFLGGAYLLVTAEVYDPLHRILGALIYALGLWPALLWIKNGGSRFPVFEPMLALCANAYAVPILQGHQGLGRFPPETITLAAVAIIIYQTSSLAAYFLTGGAAAKSRFWTEPILTIRAERIVSSGLYLSTVYTLVVTFTEIVPQGIESVTRAIFSGVSILATFVTCQRWGRGLLSLSDRIIFGTLIALNCLILASSLLMIGALSQLGLALLGYLSGGRKLPLAAIIATFLVAAVLHNGKAAMRAAYWNADEIITPTLIDLPSFYGEWIKFGLVAPDSEPGGDKDTNSMGMRLLERSSLMHMITLVVHYTPDGQPFLAGETYGYVLPQFIPRLLWPDKPFSHVATNRLSVYYGLQSEEATLRTTIAFGLPAEAYANFGLLGMAGLGLFFGFGLKKLQCLSANSPIFSLAGILMIILTAWSLNAEHTLAVWVSSLFQALIVALGIPLILRGLIDN